ncbi:MAG TPA: TetR/AcrR family transcriptional regulator [Spirochaetota bacterium]|nr:TetR/AcrR family transcriptional regulator [Spirochaetota bacterium]
MLKKGEQTRERLLHCAEKAFSKNGYYETQVSDIVKLAHVAKGTIYQYFENKDDVFKTLLSTYLRQWEKAVALDLKGFGGPKPGSYYAMEYLRHRLKKTAEFWSENQERTNIILRIAVGLNAEFESVMKHLEEKILKVIMADIELGQRWGNIPGDIDVEIAGNAILGVVFRLNYHFYVLKRRKFQKMNNDDLQNEVLKLVANLLRMKG